MNLSDREYWRTTEAAAVLGRSARYWARMAEEGCVRGYRDHGWHIQAESARTWLARLVDMQREATPEQQGQHIFWNARRRRVAS